MYKKILVPLDGSDLAECALQYAEELAKCCKSEEIILVTSTEQIKGISQKRNELMNDPAVKTVLLGLDATITNIEEDK